MVIDKQFLPIFVHYCKLLWSTLRVRAAQAARPYLGSPMIQTIKQFRSNIEKARAVLLNPRSMPISVRPISQSPKYRRRSNGRRESPSRLPRRRETIPGSIRSPYLPSCPNVSLWTFSFFAFSRFQRGKSAGFEQSAPNRPYDCPLICPRAEKCSLIPYRKMGGDCRGVV
jgi:hypothetical protein